MQNICLTNSSRILKIQSRFILKNPVRANLTGFFNCDYRIYFVSVITTVPEKLSSIENGRQNVTYLYLYKIAQAIGVEVKDFFE